jgi:hypothetical protein
MKKLQTLLAIAVGGVLLGMGLVATAQPVKPGYATVVRVEGVASYSLDGGATKIPLVAGKYLEAGATIYTGDASVVDVILGRAVQFPQAASGPQRVSYAVDAPVRGYASYRPAAEQNAVRVLANSTLAIDKLSTTSSGADTVGDTELDLKQGSIYASVKKLSPTAEYLVKTPTGIAGVRGTELFLSLNPDGTIKDLAVYHTSNNAGLVLAVTFPNGTTQTYTIKDGEIWTSGNPVPSPISPDLHRFLREVFPILRTPFYQLISFNPDHTIVLESTDF